MIVGYPTPGKARALQLVSAFCEGAGGKVVDAIPAKLLPGAAVFYGVTPATVHLWEQAKAEGREWYYIDNAYFDACRDRYFRVTKNRLQHTGEGESDCARFDSLQIAIKPWRGEGRHVLLCPQSDEFMRVVAQYPGSWLQDALRWVRERWPLRELRVRPWARDKARWYATLPDDLKDCHALVTYSSASAITAIMSGVPAAVTAEDSICRSLISKDLDGIESRRRWAGVVADNQWTLEEMRCGLAWEMLQEKVCA